MNDIGSAIRKWRTAASRALLQRRREKARQWTTAQRMRFAWIQGHTVLFKFKSMQGDSCRHVLDFIENSRAYFASPSSFNDPFDCVPVYRWKQEPPPQQLVAEALAEEEAMALKAGMTADQLHAERRARGIRPESLGEAVTESFRSAVNKVTRVFCMSATQSHPLLWSHYADSHRGVCLHLRCRPGTVFGSARGVKYQRRFSPIWIPLAYNRAQDAMADKMVLTKAQFWSYEAEFRVIHHTEVGAGYTLQNQFYEFPPEALCGITLGMQMRPVDRAMVRNWAESRYPRLPVYEAHKQRDRFWMDIKRAR